MASGVPQSRRLRDVGTAPVLVLLRKLLSYGTLTLIEADLLLSCP